VRVSTVNVNGPPFLTSLNARDGRGRHVRPSLRGGRSRGTWADATPSGLSARDDERTACCALIYDVHLNPALNRRGPRFPLVDPPSDRDAIVTTLDPMDEAAEPGALRCNRAPSSNNARAIRSHRLTLPDRRSFDMLRAQPVHG